MRPVALLSALCLASGCAPPESVWWPLEMGRSWTYRCDRGIEKFVGEWKIASSVAVGGAAGFQFTSPVGPTRVAWFSSGLFADCLAGTFYRPAVPVLVRGRREWSGEFNSEGRSIRASASVVGTQGDDRHPVYGVHVLEVESTLKWPGHERVVTTVFARGIGPVRQVQRTDGRLDYAIELVERR